MAQVDFYFGVDHRLHYACRLVRKARGAGYGVLAYARDADRLARFDTALWTFSPLDFLPHVYADSPLAEHTPILLARSFEEVPVRELLLNLDDELPPEAALARCTRIAEVVAVDASDRALARERFRRYRELGLQPKAHEVGAE